MWISSLSLRAHFFNCLFCGVRVNSLENPFYRQLCCVHAWFRRDIYVTLQRLKTIMLHSIQKVTIQQKTNKKTSKIITTGLKLDDMEMFLSLLFDVNISKCLISLVFTEWSGLVQYRSVLFGAVYHDSSWVSTTSCTLTRVGMWAVRWGLHHLRKCVREGCDGKQKVKIVDFQHSSTPWNIVSCEHSVQLNPQLIWKLQGIYCDCCYRLMGINVFGTNQQNTALLAPT